METWSASQIGQSFGAYSGRQVRFVHQGKLIEGTLTRSDSLAGPRTYLAVDGVSHVVPNATPIEVR